MHEDNDDIQYFGFVLTLVQAICFLLYPSMGILAEVYWTRYKTMLTGTYLQLVGTLILTVAAFLLVLYKFENSVFTYIMIILPYALIQLALAMIESNAIQFGTDQLLEGSSSELSSFVYWYFWAIFFGHGFISCLSLIISFWLSYFQVSGIVLVTICVIQIVCSIFLLVVVHKFEKQLEVEPVGSNPVKLIIDVLLYGYRNSVPVRRSAFTYDNQHSSRIDYCKSRFGGPFSTENVEDVKSFLQISLIFIGLIGFRFTDETIGISKQLMVIVTLSNDTTMTNPWFYFVTVDTFGISTLTILIGIPVYQLVIKHRLQLWQFFPNMLKRMFFGLLCVAMATVSIQVFHALVAKALNNEDCNLCSIDFCNFTNNIAIPFNYNYLIIPQTLNGLGFLLVFLTVMEFVLAQGPRRMQGLLIGLWYSLLSINLSIAALETFDSVSCVSFLSGIKSILMLMGIILYIPIALRYKRRVRNEFSDIHMKDIIEEYYERQLQTEIDEWENENNNLNSNYVVVSVEDTGKHYT